MKRLFSKVNAFFLKYLKLRFIEVILSAIGFMLAIIVQDKAASCCLLVLWVWKVQNMISMNVVRQEIPKSDEEEYAAVVATIFIALLAGAIFYGYTAWGTHLQMMASEGNLE